MYKNYNLKEWKLRYSMAHRGDKGTNDNVKTELLITNYDIHPKTPIEERDTMYTKEDLLEVVPHARSVPQIFIGNNLIGGYTDLVKYFSRSKNV